MSSSFSSDSFSTSSFDTDSFLFDVLTGIIVQGGGGSSTKVETKRRTYPRNTPKAVSDDQDMLDLACAVVAFLNTGTN